MMLTVALAAATDHHHQGAGFGMQVRGQMVLANGPGVAAAVDPHRRGVDCQ